MHGTPTSVIMCVPSATSHSIDSTLTKIWKAVLGLRVQRSAALWPVSSASLDLCEARCCADFGVSFCGVLLVVTARVTLHLSVSYPKPKGHRCIFEIPVSQGLEHDYNHVC